jgi:hypothetical protein
MSTSGSSCTFGDFKELVAISLQDSAMALYKEDLLFQATIGAMNAILPWCPNQKLAMIVGDGTVDTFSLPYDLYKIEALQDVSTGKFLDRGILAPGQVRNNTSSSNPVSWMEYPKKSLYLSQVPTSDYQYRLYYQAYYAMPSGSSDDTFIMPTPKSALFGMCYWAMAHCISPFSVSSAQIRQFNTRVDSGTPVDNVLEESAKFCRAMFIDEMNRQPKYYGATS